MAMNPGDGLIGRLARFDEQTTRAIGRELQGALRRRAIGLPAPGGHASIARRLELDWANVDRKYAHVSAGRRVGDRR
jgi:hypothetical protein